MKILVIDGDLILNKLISNYLTRIDYDITSGFSASEALTILKKVKFNLVLSDYKLPGIDGLAIVKQLRTAYPALPIILITNCADMIVTVNPFKLGAFVFVTKHIIPKELYKAIDMVISRKGCPAINLKPNT